jgi:Fe-coproporphyrin III synthase
VTGAIRHTVKAGLRIAVEHPSLILWYLRNRVRCGLLPLERAFGDGRSLPPRFVTLKPTLRCNLRCEFCRFVANGDVFGKRDWLEIEGWKRIIDEIAPHRPYICLTGGEPTMYPHLAELVAHIKGHGLICVLTTNGTMLEQRAGALLQAPPDLIILSIDGPREVHDRVRKASGTYDRALKGIQAVVSRQSSVVSGGGQSAVGSRQSAEASRAQNAGILSSQPSALSPHPFLVVNTAITGHTYETALEMVRVAREFGAAALNFQHFWFLTRRMVEVHNARWGDCFPLDYGRIGGTETEGVDADRLFETVQRLKQEDFGLPILFYPELDREEMRTYYAEPETFTHRMTPGCAWLSTDILPNGDVSPCFDLVCGNVLEQSFLEIWNNEPFRDHRRRLARAGPYSICARCCAYFRRD